MLIARIVARGNSRSSTVSSLGAEALSFSSSQRHDLLIMLIYPQNFPLFVGDRASPIVESRPAICEIHTDSSGLITCLVLRKHGANGWTIGGDDHEAREIYLVVDDHRNTQRPHNQT